MDTKKNIVFPIKPMGDRFIAEEIVEETEHIDGSIFLLAKNDHSKPMRVKVVEISDDFDNTGLNLKVGDEVLIPKYGSTSIKWGKEQKKFHMCCKMDVIGII